MRKHHELKAWQEAMELVKEIYRETRDFPKEEIYGLVSQMRRAAVSIPSNPSPFTPHALPRCSRYPGTN
ncbi:MAG: four helix bundle protein [Pseudomonadota bacterium]